ncbi:hypothetical protein K438DRAFT_1789122 [Mycena galopus ATCC 62051]|nr:hypothetical protein K438DRAFT_1789122 [Mycena galopus ATCC 62051]
MYFASSHPCLPHVGPFKPQLTSCDPIRNFGWNVRKIFPGLPAVATKGQTLVVKVNDKLNLDGLFLGANNSFNVGSETFIIQCPFGPGESYAFSFDCRCGSFCVFDWWHNTSTSGLAAYIATQVIPMSGESLVNANVLFRTSQIFTTSYSHNVDKDTRTSPHFGRQHAGAQVIEANSNLTFMPVGVTTWEINNISYIPRVMPTFVKVLAGDTKPDDFNVTEDMFIFAQNKIIYVTIIDQPSRCQRHRTNDLVVWIRTDKLVASLSSANRFVTFNPPCSDSRNKRATHPSRVAFQVGCGPRQNTDNAELKTVDPSSIKPSSLRLTLRRGGVENSAP